MAVLGGYGMRRLRAHPAKAVLASVLILGMGGIIGNAILFQRGRHPAPLFGTAPRAGGPKIASLPVSSVPVPEPRPPEAPAMASAAPVPLHGTEPPPAKPSSPVRAPSSPVHASTAAGKEDPIAQLIKGGGKQQPMVAAPPKTAPDSGILSAQRALEKLGYEIKPDGFLGAATRQALEKFQRERHLPVDDTLSSKMIRQIEAAAGVPST